MYLQQTSVNGENLVGLFGIATDRYAVLSNNFKKISVLDVPMIKTKVYGTNLIGIFCVGNSNGLLLPYFVSNDEIKKLRTFLDEFDVNIGKVTDRYTAIGNLLACNDKGALLSPKISDSGVIEDTLGVEVVKRDIAGHEEVGSCCIATNKGFLAHPDAESELKEISDIFKVDGNVGSVNFGFPFVKTGIIANSNGYITGLRTSGIELGRIDEALGFL